jgi:hypothetical protein
LAATCALALVAVAGLPWQPRRDSAADAHVVSAPPNSNPMPDNSSMLASLDEPPDLYLWLATDDARALLAE